MVTPARVARAAYGALLAGVVHASVAHAQPMLAPNIRASIDSSALAALKRSGAPSMSIAVVKDGELVYAKAYGDARVAPKTPATPAMRYSIGSVSKQFTSTAILLLAEQKKLALTDKVSRWLPELTRAGDVTIRQLLSMTSGYQDYWPQDYVMPPMLAPTTATKIVDEWAKKPLDFEPGTKWQYSNTNYVIAGLIVEKAANMSLIDFLRQRIFTPLGMTSVAIIDDGALGPTDPERYERFGLGPPRVAPKEGKGWLFAAGELAMTPSDLAKWDVSVMKQTVLTPASYRVQQTNVLLDDGRGTGYGLGVSVGAFKGRRMISHGGEVSGFSTQNMIFPDDRVAIVASANLFVTDAEADVANYIADVLFASVDAATTKAGEQTRTVFAGLQRGTIDRNLLSSNANAWFSANALKDFATSLGPCGRVGTVTQTAQSLRGGMTYRGYALKCGTASFNVSTFVLPNGKIEQFIVTPE